MGIPGQREKSEGHIRFLISKSWFPPAYQIVKAGSLDCKSWTKVRPIFGSLVDF
jgi:hypothetical protein